MLLTKYIKRFDKGGLIDTEAMLSDTKKDPRFFAKGAYTKSGKERIAAIQEIKDTQSKGYQYKFDDSGETFKIVDKKGELATTDAGHGVESTKKITPFYGMINNEKRSKKEVSKLLSDVATGSYLKTSMPEKMASRDKIREEEKASTNTTPTTTNTTETKTEVKTVTPEVRNERGEATLKNEKSLTTTPKVKSPVETRITKDKAPAEVVNSKTLTQAEKAEKAAEAAQAVYLKNTSQGNIVNDKSVTKTGEANKNTTGLDVNAFLDKKFDDEIVNIESMLKFDIYGSKPVSTMNKTVGDLLKHIDGIDNELKTKTVLNSSDPNLNKLANEKGIVINAINKYSKQILSEKIRNVAAAIEKNKISLTYNKNIPQNLKLKQLSKLDALHTKYDNMYRSVMNNSSTDLETIKNNLSLLQPVKTDVTSHKKGGVMKFQAGVNDLDMLFDYLNSDDFKGKKSSYYNTNGGEKFNERTLASSEKKTSGKLVKERVDWNKDGKIDEQDDKAAPTLKNKISNLIKRVGPVVTTTGLSTPLGTLQYNDIVQYLLLKKAHKKPVAEVPVNYEIFRERGVRNVQAARDIDASMLQNAQNNISSLNSGYNGSDPIMEAKLKNQIHSEKARLTADLIDKRASYRRSEEDRVNAELEQRRLQASEDLLRENDVHNRNNEKDFQAKLSKAEAERNKESAFYQGIGNLSANIQSRINNDAETRKQLAYEIDARDYATKESKLLSQLKTYSTAKASDEIIAKQNNKSFDPSEYDKKIEDISNQIDEHRKNRDVLSDYDKMSKGKPLFKNK